MLVKSAASAQKVAEAQVQFLLCLIVISSMTNTSSIFNLQTWTANLKPSPKSYVTQYLDICCSQ